MNNSFNNQLSVPATKRKDHENSLSAPILNSINRSHGYLKVAIYIDSMQGYGADRVLLKIANGLAEQGVCVDLIVAKRIQKSNFKIKNAINVFNLNSSRFNPAKNVFFLQKYIRRNKPDCLLSSIHFNNVVAACALVISTQQTRLILRQANILEEQFKDYHSVVSLALHKAVKLAYKRADLLIAPCQSVADDMKKYIGASPKKIKIIYNPTVTSEIFEKSQAEVKHEWIAKQYPIILSIGRLKPQKDFKTLLKAFSKVKQQIKQAKLIIIGEGFQRKQLQNLAIRLGIEQDVDLAGYMENPYPFIRKASLFVSSSRYEGLPNVLIEALALGAKIVATDARGGSAEILEDGKYGELVPVGNANLMA